ncbi:MAG: flavodoxin [Campylobacteraceae bacterium]|jgi:flavodoxin|nr:flavodoxin [Campylobacteraceae bacterium]
MKKFLLAVMTILTGAQMQANTQAVKEQKVLIAYFSWGGNTKTIAEYIHEAAGGDMFEIKTLQPYPKEYNPTVDTAKEEQRLNARPKLSATIDNMSGYDTVFLGYPNWWGTIPMALFTFLEAYDLTGKTIIPFCTHEGSGFGSSIDDIKRLSPNALILQGFVVRGGSVKRAKNDVDKWISRLDIGGR